MASLLALWLQVLTGETAMCPIVQAFAKGIPPFLEAVMDPDFFHAVSGAFGHTCERCAGVGSMGRQSSSSSNSSSREGQTGNARSSGTALCSKSSKDSILCTIKCKYSGIMHGTPMQTAIRGARDYPLV